MVPDKRQKVTPARFEYSHLMKFEKTKKWKDSKIKTADDRDRKREERMKKKEMTRRTKTHLVKQMWTTSSSKVVSQTLVRLNQSGERLEATREHQVNSTTYQRRV